MFGDLTHRHRHRHKHTDTQTHRHTDTHSDLITKFLVKGPMYGASDIFVRMYMLAQEAEKSGTRLNLYTSHAYACARVQTCMQAN